MGQANARAALVAESTAAAVIDTRHRHVEVIDALAVAAVGVDGTGLTIDLAIPSREQPKEAGRLPLQYCWPGARTALLGVGSQSSPAGAHPPGLWQIPTPSRALKIEHTLVAPR